MLMIHSATIAPRFLYLKGMHLLRQFCYILHHQHPKKEKGGLQSKGQGQVNRSQLKELLQGHLVLTQAAKCHQGRDALQDEPH
mmetsp:Transcript_67537/g.82778  ORF Transcript_67537/g.82778 Transcript_67537/m.82778 type:complete len:83 (-) Transcript_67537:261-509(-)